MKAILIGILPAEKIRERILAIARGSCKPMTNEPKVWFRSMESLTDTLGDESRALRRELIQKMQPASLAALAQIAGREPGDLSRTTKTVSDYEIVELKLESDEIQLVAVTTEFDLVMP